MTANAIAVRTNRARGIHPKPRALSQSPRKKVDTLPEYLEKGEVDALIRNADHAEAELLMLVQWRAGLRVSEALDLQFNDLRALAGDRPQIRIRQGKGYRAREVPVHPELAIALDREVRHRRRGRGQSLFSVTRRTALRWVKSAQARAEEKGQLEPGKRIGTHTLRHSYARYLLSEGIPINQLSLWMGHRSIETTLIYLRLIPDASGSLARIP